MKIGVLCEEYSYCFYKNTIMYEELIEELNYMIDKLRKITSGNLSHNLFHIKAYAHWIINNQFKSDKIPEKEFNRFIDVFDYIVKKSDRVTTGNYSHEISSMICLCSTTVSLFKLFDKKYDNKIK